MRNLVEFLSRGEHPVVLSCVDSVHELPERLDLGYILVRFTDTQGGTELGFELDREKSVAEKDALSAGKGHIELTGRLELDYVPIEVTARFTLPALEGMGRVLIL